MRQLLLIGSVVISCAIVIVFSNGEGRVAAQVAADGKLPTSVITGGPNFFIINGGTQPAGSNNLFHSFSQFSIPTGGAALFNNPPNVENIIARVTGGSISNINGRIIANSSANLYLINPSGIVFGPNASLNIGGSFLASTANSIKFADGYEFSAINPQSQPLLTVSMPIGLQFGSTPKPIINQSQASIPQLSQPVGLAVLPGKTLALVGGDVSLANGNLTASGGQIKIGAVGANSFVSLTPTTQGLVLGYADVQSFKNIQLSNNASVDTSGFNSGSIALTAERVSLTNGSRLVAFNLGVQSGGNISVDARESVEITGTGTYVQDFQRLATGSGTASDFRNGFFTVSAGTGAAGDIVIRTNSFIAQNGAFVQTSTFGPGQGGNLKLVSNSVDLAASALLTGTGPGSTGNSGALTIDTVKLTARDNGLAATSSLGQGQSGVFTVNATESIELFGSNPIPLPNQAFIFTGLATTTLGSGAAGNLKVDTKRLSLQNGAAIVANTIGFGSGADVIVNAKDAVILNGRSPDSQFRSGLSAQTVSTGRGGTLKISTRNLFVQNGAAIDVVSFGTGPAGNIKVNANSLQIENQSNLQAFSQTGGGGNISLQVNNLLLLRRNSSVSATAAGNGNGGNININSGFLVAVPQENSDITANAVAGAGGRIQINTQALFGIQPRSRLTPASDITASSESGVDGVIAINTPDIDPSRGFVVLPTDIVDTSGLVDAGCAAFNGKTGSQFTVTGRGGLPSSPDESLSSDVVWSDSRISTAMNVHHSRKNHLYQTSVHSDSIRVLPATGWIFDDQGKVRLINHISSTENFSIASHQSKCQTP